MSEFVCIESKQQPRQSHHIISTTKIRLEPAEENFNAELYTIERGPFSIVVQPWMSSALLSAVIRYCGAGWNKGCRTAGVFGCCAAMCECSVFMNVFHVHKPGCVKGKGGVCVFYLQRRK
jgi:hypothetical protein